MVKLGFWQKLHNGQKFKETSDTVDKDGKKSQKTATYTYDLLGRIKKETKTGSEDISYTYDSNNHRKEMTVGNKVTAHKYNKNDELLCTDTLNTDTEEDSVVIYKYDKNGNQLATVNRYEIPSDKKDSTFVDIDVTLGDNRLSENVVNHYNALNQLTKTLTKSYKVDFTYDAERLRTSKTVNGEKTVFVWDGDQLVMELSEGGKVQKRYIRVNDLVYADKGTGTEKLFYVINPHGDVVQLTDETGKVTKTYEYDSFGNEVNPVKKDENLFRYCGEYNDKETAEIYLRAGYYQPADGRFITRDTYTGEEEETLTLNLYTYCENDGVNKIDPTGHWGRKIHIKITKRALKKVTKIKNSSRYIYKKIIYGSTYPDKVRDTNKKVLNMSLNDKATNGNWHGKKKLNQVRAFSKKVKKKIKNSSNKKGRSILLGCILHSLEDWYAHSYGGSVNEYKNNPNKYAADSAMAKFHIDKERKTNEKGEVVKLVHLDTEHSKWNDSVKKDFDKKKGDWDKKDKNFDNNKRIRGAINEAKKFLRAIK